MVIYFNGAPSRFVILNGAICNLITRLVPPVIVHLYSEDDFALADSNGTQLLASAYLLPKEED